MKRRLLTTQLRSTLSIALILLSFLGTLFSKSRSESSEKAKDKTEVVEHVR